MNQGTRHTNQEWLDALSAHDPALLQELHDILRRWLLAAFSAKVEAPHLEAFAEDIAQQSVLKVLEKQETFLGQSQFLTWATKIAIRIGLSELRHARWKETSLDQLIEEHPSFMMPTDEAASPEQVLEQKETLHVLNTVLEKDLTLHQRTVLLSLLIHKAPIDVVASQMGISRNAVYKTIHDARKRLKHSLAKRGYSIDGILTPFR
jgi:RNA polymerase sigma-70 factor (ECF subfamily)